MDSMDSSNYDSGYPPSERLRQFLQQETARDIENYAYSDLRELAKSLLQSRKYKQLVEPTRNPCSTEHTFEIPGINEFCDVLNWDDGWHPVDKTSVISTYTEFLPTDDAIRTLLQYEPIIELDASNGYYSYVLNQAGATVLATSLFPEDVHSDDYPDGFFDQLEEHGYLEDYQFISVERTPPEHTRMWYDVQIADHTCIEHYESHTPLLYNPPADRGWVNEVLEYCHLGQELVVIGEWYPGKNANPPFFKDLIDNWELVDDFAVYNWKTTHTHGYVFEKSQEQGESSTHV